MGRGRQKAKHTKVARELKYFSPNTNYGALERELTHSSASEPDYVDKWGDVEVDDPNNALADEFDDEAYDGDAFDGNAFDGDAFDGNIDETHSKSA